MFPAKTDNYIRPESNVVCDALTPFRIEITELPIRPGSVWKKIQEGKA
jgi:hypothetical protein